MAIRFKDTISINEEYTFPLEDGTADQILATDGAGNISFVDVAGGEAVKIECKNTSGSTITKGTPVYVTGTVGTSFRVEVAPADASNSAKMPAVGLLETDLANNGEGYVVTGGLLKNLTTDPIDGTNTTSNDTIYVKAGGGLTMTKPTGSNLIQNIGKVGRVNSANAGSIVVSSILRTNDVPNLTEGKIWVGSANNTIESTVVHIDETNSRVGIGTNSPTVKLEINPSSGDADLILSSNGTQTLRLDQNSIRTTTTNDLTLFTNGNSNQLVLDSGGNIGIGTNSPDVKLEVIDASPTDGVIADFVNSTNAGGTVAAIKLSNADSEACDVILGANRVGANFGSDFFISLSDSVDGTNQERFRITEAGVATFTGPVISEGPDGGMVMREWTAAATYGMIGTANMSGDEYSLLTDGTDTFIGSGTGGTTYIRGGANDSSPEIRVDGSTIIMRSAGADTVLNIGGNSTGQWDPVINLHQFGSSVATEGAQIWYDNSVGDLHISTTYANDAADIHFYTRTGADKGTNNERLTISGNGNVGIGYNSPSNTLHIYKNATIGAITSTTTANAGLRIQDSNTSMYFDGNSIVLDNTGYLTTNGAYNFVLGTNNTARIHIDSGGNIGIGTTSPSYKLDVSGTIHSAGQIITTQNQITTNIGTTSAIRLDPASTTNTTGKSSIFLGTSPVDNYGISLRGARLGTDGTPTFEVATHFNSANGTVALSIDNSQNSIATTSFRAPIFYDSDNTGYYVDPATLTNLSEITVRSIQRWYRPGNNAHQRVDARLDGTDQARMHWYGKDDANVTRNFKHAWYDGAQYVNVTAANDFVYFDRVVDTVSVQADGSFRAPIFYDSNNTSYYTNPAGTSVMGFATFEGFDNTGFNARNTVGVSVGRYSSEYSYIELASSNASNLSWIDFSKADGNDYWHRIRGYNGYLAFWGAQNEEFRIYSSYTLALGSSRAPIFYDSSNTAYYSDQASTSRFNTLNTYGPIMSGDTYTDPDVVFAIHEYDTDQSIRDKLKTTSTNVTREVDGTAPAGGCFQVSGPLNTEAFTPFYKIDDNQEYTFEVWIKWISGTDNDSRLYAGSRFYDSSRTYLGNSQRYWASNGNQFDANSSNSGWYHVSGTLGPSRGSSNGNIPTAAEYMRLLFLFNYSGGDTVTRYCGLKVFKSDKTITSLYRKSLGTQVSTSENRNLVIDNNGDIYAPKFIDSDNNAWYVDPASTTYLNNVVISSTAASTGGYSVDIYDDVHLHDFEINYVRQLHFNDNVRFYDDGNDNYLNFKYGDADVGGIKFRNGSDALKGYIYASSAGFGLLGDTGSWSVRIPSGGSGLELRSGNNIEFTVNDDHTISHGSSRAPIFYDSDNTAYYCNPNSTSRLYKVITNTDQDRVKLGVWTSTGTYGMGMMTGFTFGPLNNNYAMTFEMNNDSNRGFWWGDDAHTNAEGAMALTTDGRLTVARSLRVGYGESDTTSLASGMQVSGDINATGDVVAYSSSDERLKDNKKNIDNALEKVESLNGVEFDWNDKQDVYSGHDVGVIAQEVEKVLPEIVNTRDTGYKAVKYEKLVPLLIEAVKELSEKVKMLENK